MAVKDEARDDAPPEDRKNWYMKFAPGRWRGAEDLRACHSEAQGMWINMLCIAFQAPRQGYMEINGERLSDEQICNMTTTGVSLARAKRRLLELERTGVFSRDADGTIFCRSMVRAAKTSETNRKNGSRGGNPNLGRNSDDSPNSVGNPVNRHDKRNDKRNDETNVVPITRSDASVAARDHAGGEALEGARADVSESRVKSLEEDPHHHHVSQSPLMVEFQPEALEIVRTFEAQRLELWPNESRFPSSAITLAAQATVWLKLGAPVGLILQTMDRQMLRLRDKPNGRAPTDLQFCGLSVENEAAKFLAANSGSGLTAFGSARGVDVGSALVDPAEAQRLSRIDSYRRTGFWMEQWGPEPKDDVVLAGENE